MSAPLTFCLASACQSCGKSKGAGKPRKVSAASNKEPSWCQTRNGSQAAVGRLHSTPIRF